MQQTSINLSTFDTLSGGSKVWIYTCETALADATVQEITESAKRFLSDWQAHGKDLVAAFSILENRFFILTVDEEVAQATGCSIDKATRFMQQLDEKYQLDLFNRTRLYYWYNDKWNAAHFQDVVEKVKTQELPNTLEIVDTTSTHLQELRSGFIKPFNQSWLQNF